MDEVILGTYEGFVVGFSVFTEEGIPKLKQTFATHSHTSSVRCVSTGKHFLASGGTDDKVVVIDLKSRKEHTVLMNHDGTINTIAFTNNGTHLITGSDDGSIIVTRTGNWQIEKIWKKAHGGQPITTIAVHPSDKLALSVGGDKTLRTWNLVKGRPAFTMNLSSKGLTLPSEIVFSPDGTRFSLVSNQTVDVWNLNAAGLEKRVTCNSKPTTVRWNDDDKIFVGLDNGNIISLMVSNSQALTYAGHKKRVKCLHYENNTLYSASSSGEIKVWSISDNKIKEICSASAGCRITCITLNRQSHLIKKEDASETKEEDINIEDLPAANENSDDSDYPAEKIKIVPKRKPTAFVKVSYDGDQEDEVKPLKKIKKRKHRKSNKKVE